MEAGILLLLLGSTCLGFGTIFMLALGLWAKKLWHGKI